MGPLANLFTLEGTRRAVCLLEEKIDSCADLKIWLWKHCVKDLVQVKQLWYGFVSKFGTSKSSFAFICGFGTSCAFYSGPNARTPAPLPRESRWLSTGAAILWPFAVPWQEVWLRTGTETWWVFGISDLSWHIWIYLVGGFRIYVPNGWF